METRAEPEAVWAALTDAEELTRWFPPRARVEPGVGGSVWMSWDDEGFEASQGITLWEPPSRLRLEIEVPDLAAPLATDYFLRARSGGGTALRIVQSGFSADASWDGQYDASVRGWRLALSEMKHMLERHRGEYRVFVSSHRDLEGRDQGVCAFNAIVGEEMLAASGGFEGLSAGDAYSATTAWGESISGRVIVHVPGKDLAVSVKEWGDAYVNVMIAFPTLTGWTGRAIVRASFWGGGRAEAEPARGRIGAAMEGLTI